MPNATHRYKEYLENYHFNANSVDFRIVSSRALEKWKNVQSFQLNQVVNGRFYFPQDRRETLLLKYDLWSRWLYEVENLMIELGGDHHSVELQDHDIDIIISLASKTANCYEEIMRNETSFFDQKFISIWLETHNYVFEYLINELKLIRGSYQSVFVQIVDLLTEVMQYTLTEIHELNHLMNNHEEPIFLVITDFCLTYTDKTGDCLVKKRIETYKKHFEFKSVYLKNYTNSTPSPKLFDNIESAGVTIDLKKSLFN